MIKVSTVKGGKDYYATTDRRYRFILDDDGLVFVYTASACLGGYLLERFGGRLSPGSIRDFMR